MAEGLQKQEEEMMDSSPDPMDMEIYLTKPRQKVVRALQSAVCVLLSAVLIINIQLKRLFKSIITLPPPLTPQLLFQTSAAGGLAPDSVSTGFLNPPHVS